MISIYSIIKRINGVGKFEPQIYTLSVELTGIRPIQFDNRTIGDFARKWARNLKLGLLLLFYFGTDFLNYYFIILFMRVFLLI